LYRWYAPALQRWLNLDPSGEDDGINLSAFAHNFAANAVDDFGLGTITFGTKVIGVPSSPEYLPYAGPGLVSFKYADGTHFSKMTQPAPENVEAQRRWQRNDCIKTFRKNGGDDFLMTAATLPFGGEGALLKVETAFAKELTARKALLAGEEELVKIAPALKQAYKDASYAAVKYGENSRQLEVAADAYYRLEAKAKPIQSYIRAAKQNLEKAIKESADAVSQYLK